MSGLKDMDNNLASKELNNKEEDIPILLLSKDLINHINLINENDIEINNNKNNNKDMNIKCFYSREPSSVEDQSLKRPELNNMNINSEINQKDENKNTFSSKLLQPSTMNLNSLNGNIPQSINISRQNNNKDIIQKNPNEFNFLINNRNNNNYFNNNNNVQNNMNIMNSCFTMNGKTGWICSNCKNFNYESKYIFK